jgi:hypothetical protein
MANVVFGAWVAISSFVLGFSHLAAARWNNVAVGLAVLVLAFARKPRQRGIGVLNVLFGAWLIISPFVLAISTPAVVWNNIIFGALIVITGLVTNAHATPHAGPPR